MKRKYGVKIELLHCAFSISYASKIQIDIKSNSKFGLKNSSNGRLFKWNLGGVFLALAK